MIHSLDHPTKISHQSKLQRINDSSFNFPRGKCGRFTWRRLEPLSPPTHRTTPNRNGCNPPIGLKLFTPSDLQSTPSRRHGAPNGLLPTQPRVLVAPPNCRVPTRNRLRSIANNHVSRHTPAPAPLIAFQPERQAESWLPPPLGLDRLLSLLV